MEALVLQLQLQQSQLGAAFSIMRAFGFGLMMPAPERPMPVEAHIWRTRSLQMCDQPSQFLHAYRNEGDRFDQAAADRLLLFALLDEASLLACSKRARKQARKAKASMESVI